MGTCQQGLAAPNFSSMQVCVLMAALPHLVSERAITTVPLAAVGQHLGCHTMLVCVACTWMWCFLPPHIFLKIAAAVTLLH